ncbi:hypothetical protein M409DRAFT_20476 [Zasmidium cellare ATCC 36951]|uniref:RING-type domain-containing protein n=1 Tax=Zasmidium cellare ATCC 36951 TaxID=1080233 RepID=A0A6A6CRC6_ZASCE|nr:uncharacterized protein M409DRAFT_20476 [Zasmidium cellare ATCC 36951]KAF2169253.1 hypothetical protein M409DRAFT_20476 [Zasmidium cellare ATCC 36951]
MAPVNHSKTYEDSPDRWMPLYAFAALSFGCLSFIFTPILHQEHLFHLPTRRQFLASEFRPSTQRETLGSCPICRDRLFEAVRLPCSHVYCDDCIRAALNAEQGRCPYCQQVLFCESIPWDDIADRAKFTFWCIALIGFLTLNLWASARYLGWRSEMMWRYDYFLDVELAVQLVFVALMSWTFPVPAVSEPEDVD